MKLQNLRHLIVVALLTSAANAWAAGQPAKAWTGDLRPLDATEWTRERAAHLLERAGFGGTPAQVERLHALGLRGAVAQLVRPAAVLDPAVAPFEPSGIPDDGIDPFPPTRPQLTDDAKASGRGLGLDAKPGGSRPLQPVVDKFFFWLRVSWLECNRLTQWWAQRMLVTERPLVEKTALFWHGHFASHEDKVRDWRKMHQQVQLFQTQGLGDFRTLMKAVSRDPAMLSFLDAGVNIKGAPNENFAREIMEMFTLGIGQYGERDIREAARAFTGYNYDGTRFAFIAAKHDDGVKALLGASGRFDGDAVIDLLLAQPAAAEYIASRLYRFFVREELSPALAQRLGALLVEKRWDTASLLEAIFLSRDFYAAESVGTRIKGPVELVVGTYRKLGVTAMPGLPDFNDSTRALGQHLLHPPTVAGWAQGRAWITPGLLMERGNFIYNVLFPDFLAVANDRYPVITVGNEVRAVHERIRRGLDISAATMPEAPAGEAGMMAQTRSALEREEDFNTRYGSYRGWQRAVEAVTPIPRTVARPNLSAMVLASGAATTGDVVDLLAHHFFSVPMSAEDRAAWTAFLTRELGTERIERARSYMEDGLRALLHRMLSSPDYQLG